MSLLRQAIRNGSFLLDLKADSLESIIHQAVNLVVMRGVLAPEHRDEIEHGLMERERVACTAIGRSTSVPHVYSEHVTEQVILFVRLARPINLGAPDGTPTRFIWLLLGPADFSSEHLDALADIARHMSDDEFCYELRVASTLESLNQAFDNFDRRNAPPTTESKEPSVEFVHSGRFGGGLMADLHRRLQFYASDFRDGLNLKTISSVLFLYFACLAPAITFGAIYADETAGHIGVMELLVGTAVCGIVYAISSGQPLIILGGTGPLLIFTIILFDLCKDDAYNLPFLETRAWVGIWTGLIVILFALTDASCLIRFFTRFTDEIFSALISLIFIFKAMEHIGHGLSDVDSTHTLAMGLVDLILAIGTFGIAMSLSRLRSSRYLRHWMREFIADFGPSIAVIAMSIAAVLWFSMVDVDSMQVEGSVQPTLVDAAGVPRPWLLNIFSVDSWVIWATIGPAILLAMLVYADQNITARLVNSPDHRLQKGAAYHWDLAVVGGLLILCSVLGWPWLVAATVRSLNHVRSLATVEKTENAAGDQRERIIHVRETRITGIFIHLLIGGSLLFVNQMGFIPLAVLYGLFLFMGIVSLSGNQFFERITLWVTDPALFPGSHYVRNVPRFSVHLFTIFQASCLLALWFIKESPRLGILFPLFIVGLIPIRFGLNRIFDAGHLAALDAEEEPSEDELQWT